MDGVRVKTDGDNFASVDYGRVHVEFSKDGDSPNCPDSWTWGVRFDGEHIGSSCDEMSLSACADDAQWAIGEAIGELSTLRDWLIVYGAFGEGER